jgi:hypothetical protein
MSALNVPTSAVNCTDVKGGVVNTG